MLRGVASSGGGSATSIVVGTTAITGGAAYAVLREDGSQNLAADTALRFGGAAAGLGLQIAAGTATTDVAALSVTRTNNNAAVATGVQIAFTDTTSAAGFLPFQILGGAAGSTSLFKVSKTGVLTSGAGQILLGTGGGGISVSGNDIYLQPVVATRAQSLFDVGSGNDSNALIIFNTSGTGISKVSSGVVGVGTGAVGSVAGTLAATNYRVASTPVILGTAPTVASGGCTSPTAVTSNGTAAFSVGVGTSCSGSQPLVFTLPAAAIGWNCYAKNTTNGATSAPAQTSAVSTTSVTITNFNRTTGVAAAWTDADVVVVSCMGY